MHIILLADKNKLSRGRMILVLEKIMHAQPKISKAELAKILAGDHERIEIVLFQVSSKLAALFFVFSPEKSCYQKQQRHNDRRDNIDTKFALHSLDHGTNIFGAALATGLQRMPAWTQSLGKRLTEPWLQRTADA